MEAESSFVRDRTNLDKAHKSKDQANDAYKEGDYAVAIKLYHECLLFAKAVTQLSITGLQVSTKIHTLSVCCRLQDRRSTSGFGS